MKKEENKKFALEILKRMKGAYPEAGIALKYKTPAQLLCAVVMSAQTTDEQVNKVCAPLFLKYKSFSDFAAADIYVFEKEISSVNFFRAKAKNIVNAARIIEKEHNGALPDNIDALVQLPGVGRKTANILTWHIYDKADGIVVDTHVKRVSFNLALTKNTDPVKIERDLMVLYPQKEWGMIGHYFQAYGRTFMRARGKPLMKDCLEGLKRA